MATIVTKPIINKIRIAETDINRLELPEGYELRRIKTKAEKIAELEAEIARLEVERGEEPNVKELIEFAKMMHPYYQTQMQIDKVKKRMKKCQ